MIKPLTSFRFFFAMMVFSHHLMFVIDQNSTDLLKFYHKFLHEGYLGVGFFFILSGYILSHAYYNIFQNNKFNTISFYFNRLARIYPTHFLTLILALPFSFKFFEISIWQWLSRFFENLILIQSFNPNLSHYFSFNVVAWSISDEMFFYLLFPFILKFILSLKKIQTYLVVGGMSIIILSLMYITDNSYHHYLFYINPIFRLADFIIGIILFRLFSKMEITSIKKATHLELLSVIILTLFYSISNFIPQVLRLSIFYWLPISFMIVIFSKSYGRLSHFLSKNIFFVLGEISFGFYLYHLLVIKYIGHINNKFHIINNDIVLIMIVLSISFLISYLSYHLFEKRAKEWVRNVVASKIIKAKFKLKPIILKK